MFRTRRATWRFCQALPGDSVTIRSPQERKQKKSKDVSQACKQGKYDIKAMQPAREARQQTTYICRQAIGSMLQDARTTITKTYDGRVHVAGRKTTTGKPMTAGPCPGPCHKTTRQRLAAVSGSQHDKRPTGKAPRKRNLDAPLERNLNAAKCPGQGAQCRRNPRRCGGTPNTQVTRKQRPSLAGVMLPHELAAPSSGRRTEKKTNRNHKQPPRRARRTAVAAR